MEYVLSPGALLRFSELGQQRRQAGQPVQPITKVISGYQVAKAEEDVLFPQLREHLTSDSVWATYYQMSQSVDKLVAGWRLWMGVLMGLTYTVLLSKTQNQEELVDSLRQNAILREQTTRVVRFAALLLGSELFALAVGNTLTSLQEGVRSARWELEHDLQAYCAATGYSLTGDEMRQTAHDVWDGRIDLLEAFQSVLKPTDKIELANARKSLTRLLELWRSWQRFKDATEQRLSVLVKEYPFPGRCKGCAK